MSVKSGKPERSIQENCAGGRFRVKWGEVRYGVETGPAHAVRAGRLQREGRADKKNAADSARGANFTLTDTVLERANRVPDFMEFGELLARDALVREESCGGPFRTEYQTPDGEAERGTAHLRDGETGGAELQVAPRLVTGGTGRTVAGSVWARPFPR